MATITLNGQSLNVLNPDKSKSTGDVSIRRVIGSKIFGLSSNDIVPYTSIANGYKYVFTVGSEVIDSRGIVGGTANPLVFIPRKRGRILRDIAFSADIYAGETPMQSVQMIIGGDVPLVLSDCKESGCDPGYVCADTGDCIPKIADICTECSGDCFARCPGAKPCVKGADGKYFCSEEGGGFPFIAMLILFAIVIAVFVGLGLIIYFMK